MADARQTSRGTPAAQAADAVTGSPRNRHAAVNANPTDADIANDGAPPNEEHGGGEDSWLTRPRRQELKSLGTSIVAHGALLVSLGAVSLAIPRRDDQKRVLQSIERPVEQISQRLDEELTPTETLSVVPAGSVPTATHGDPLEGGAGPNLDQHVVDSVEGAQVSLADVSLKAIPGIQLTSGLGMDSPGEPMAQVDGYGAAMDRITQELLLLLSRGQVLVMWLFDESESVKGDREEINKRVAKVYEELGLAGAAQGDALWTSVGSFGESVTQHTRRPTADLDEIHAAIEGVPIDESGTEVTYRAAIETISKHRRFGAQGDRQLVLIIVTDETGDDADEVEFAIAAAREAGCRVYVLGRESPFGYPYVTRTWTWNDPEGKEKPLTFWLRINRGPETAQIEQLQTNGLWHRHDAHESGFGPYVQTRLCRETGGTFFMLPNMAANTVDPGNWRFEREAMRPYLPDLGSREDYLIELNESELRRTLYEVITALNPWENSQLDLRERFPLRMQELAAAVAPELKKASQLISAYDAAEKRLDQIAEARTQEPLPRWQANYDLVYAQVICYKVRVYEYAAYLDAFLKNPKAVQLPTTTFWRIVTRPRTIADEQTGDYVSRATGLFEKIIVEHAGTPYAKRAEWELQRGFGVELVEDLYDPRHYTLGPKIKKPNL